MTALRTRSRGVCSSLESQYPNSAIACLHAGNIATYYTADAPSRKARAMMSVSF
jgi:hypothetical protein